MWSSFFKKKKNDGRVKLCVVLEQKQKNELRKALCVCSNKKKKKKEIK